MLSWQYLLAHLSHTGFPPQSSPVFASSQKWWTFFFPFWKGRFYYPLWLKACILKELPYGIFKILLMCIMPSDLLIKHQPARKTGDGWHACWVLLDLHCTDRRQEKQKLDSNLMDTHTHTFKSQTGRNEHEIFVWKKDKTLIRETYNISIIKKSRSIHLGISQMLVIWNLGVNYNYAWSIGYLK